MFVNKEQMLIMFSLTVLSLMVGCNPFFFFPQPCSGNSTRERSAYVLRQPGAGKECPPTKETEPCKLNSNCFHYSYNITGKPKSSNHLLLFVIRVCKIMLNKMAPCRLEYLSAQWSSSVWKWHQNTHAGLCAQRRQIRWPQVLQRGEQQIIFFFKLLLFCLLKNVWGADTVIPLVAGPGEEVADECLLCCRMSRQLPAVWLVPMVWVHPYLWAGR